MADFDMAFDYMILNEGKVFTNMPLDKGGPTMWGITLAVAKHYGFDATTMQTMSEDEIRRIYQTEFWKFNGIQDQRVSSKIFDMGVNFGLAGAVRLAQTVCGFYGQKLTCDGIYGPQTEKAINEVLTDKMLQGLCDACVAKYQRIVSADPSQKKFFRGWVTRAKRLPE